MRILRSDWHGGRKQVTRAIPVSIARQETTQLSHLVEGRPAEAVTDGLFFFLPRDGGDSHPRLSPCYLANIGADSGGYGRQDGSAAGQYGWAFGAPVQQLISPSPIFMAQARKEKSLATKRFRVYLRAVEYPWVTVRADSATDARRMVQEQGLLDVEHSEFYDPEWEVDQVVPLDDDDP